MNKTALSKVSVRSTNCQIVVGINTFLPIKKHLTFLWPGRLMVLQFLFLWHTLLWRLDYLWMRLEVRRTLTSWMFWLELSREQPQRASAQYGLEEDTRL